MKIGVPKEVVPGERRVALVPDAVATLKKGSAAIGVLVEAGAGGGAYFTDADYEKAGATIAGDAARLFAEADIIVKVQRPTADEASLILEGSAVVSQFQPVLNLDIVRTLAARNVTAFSMDLIPRISRAQSMDVLSSQAAASGYKAVLIAAQSLGRFFPMLTTAAGTIFAAKVLVLGAGVAGLQAIATARRLGAVVFGYDVRPVVKEQVESLGAKFLQFDLGEKDTEDKGGYARQLSKETQQRQQQWLADQIKGFDVVITTALVPGKPAPRLINRETVERMRPGSIIVDLAAEAGGNCEVTEAGKVVEHKGVIVHGPVNLPSSTAVHASQMYARNITSFLAPIIKEGNLQIDLSDEVLRAALVTYQGAVVHEGAKAALAGSAAGVKP
ncbi:MAG TPA: Re/Si-specific NAD(P)(+) transhydrogenase subunit alpha [Tepidisphaeraceae bacterium]|jgi:NAD(P) transhydrogenase subunit alpha